MVEQAVSGHNGDPAGTASTRRAERNELIISYLFLRKTVGWIGCLLPVVLCLSSLFYGDRPYSMSGYYYTHMRDVFVGALCALGVFLVAYAGYDELDRWITNIAGACAIGVAFFPTKPAVCAANAGACVAPAVRHLSLAQQVVGDIHLFFATVTFTALGLMALRFAKPGPTPQRVAWQARIRHGLGLAGPRAGASTVYRSCGIAILSCVVLAALSNLLPASVKAHVPLLFIFEAVAVFGFGVSWFVKGRALESLRPAFRRLAHPRAGRRRPPAPAVP